MVVRCFLPSAAARALLGPRSATPKTRKVSCRPPGHSFAKALTFTHTPHAWQSKRSQCRMDALVLLEQWQGEHERNEHGLHQYAKQKDLLLRALKERTIATQDLQEETVGIKKKTVESAGTSALQLQLIEQEEQEGQVLDGEISRLTEEVRLKEAELERCGWKSRPE